MLLAIDPMLRRLYLFLAALALALLSACASGGLSSRDGDKSYFNAPLGAVNHTGRYLYSFYVKAPSARTCVSTARQGQAPAACACPVSGALV
jgi:hypothetical protein